MALVKYSNLSLKPADDIKYKRAILINSAPSEWDELGRVVGDMNIPLSPAGEEHAEKLRDLLDSDFSAIMFAGPSTACRETARIITRNTRTHVEVSDDLKDMNWGLWQGMWLHEIKRRFYKPYELWMQNPLAVVTPNGESVEDLAERVDNFLEKKILHNHRQTEQILATPMIIAVLKALMLKNDWKDFWQDVMSPQKIEYIELPLE